MSNTPTNMKSQFNNPQFVGAPTNPKSQFNNPQLVDALTLHAADL